MQVMNGVRVSLTNSRDAYISCYVSHPVVQGKITHSKPLAVQPVN